eukprot:Ihof_evm11s15 gene=Ihof_evmTU11s15
MEYPSKECILSYFKEGDQVIELLKTLSSTDIDPDKITWMIGVFDIYNEQATLLDQHLEEMVFLLAKTIQSVNTNCSRLHMACKILTVLVKVRGRKVVVRLLPHAPSDLIATLELLLKQDKDEYTTWETRYILLLWLSLLVLLPFDLTILDTPIKGAGGKSLSISLEELGRSYLIGADRCTEAAGIMLGRLLTRKDMEGSRLEVFMHWAKNRVTVASNEGKTANLLGVLHALLSLFKYGRRETMDHYVTLVQEILKPLQLAGTNSCLARRQSARMASHMALAQLPIKHRFTKRGCGARSLAVGLTPAHHMVHKNPITHENEEIEVDEDDWEVSMEVEEVIGYLLVALADKDTVVRWAAAKGLGRVCERLPIGFSQEVVQGVIEVFSECANHTAWHGGCLALAELVRRGLLPVKLLDQVIPIVIRGLGYDRLVGSHSVGAHVRDAACYVCWAFARAYNGSDLEQYLIGVARALLCVALYDREVNCRRAASAAFQEHVGRHGLVFHGINIVSLADYHAIGLINNSYLNVAPIIAQYSDYTMSLVDHLAQVKLRHWDVKIRALAAEGLAKLAPYAYLYICQGLISQLVVDGTSRDLPTRHGALLALGHLIPALNTGKESSCWKSLVSLETINQLILLPNTLATSRRLYNGAGTDMIRTAWCCLLANGLANGVPLPDKPTVSQWQGHVDANLSCDNERVQTAAASAVRSLCTYVYMTYESPPDLAPIYLSRMIGAKHFIQRGLTMAIGALPKSMLMGHEQAIIRSLVSLLTNKKPEPVAAPETKCQVLAAFGSMCLTLGGANGLGDREISVILEGLLAGLKDYTLDHRGDIGCTVREVALVASLQIITLLTQSNHLNEGHFLLDETTCTTLLCAVIEQAWGRIDRTRGIAGTTLVQIIHMEPPIQTINDRIKLMDALPRSLLASQDWGQCSTCFPLILPFLSISSYRSSAFLSLATAAGSTGESTVRHATSCLLSYMIGLDVQEVGVLGDILLNLLRENKSCDRIVIPLLKTTDMLLANGCFANHPSKDNFGLGLVNIVKIEMATTSDFNKLSAALGVLCSLLQFDGPIRHQALLRVLLLIGHRFPRLRKLAAEQLYVAMVTWEGIAPIESACDVTALLEETEWGGPMDEVREFRDELCSLLGIPAPKRL